MSLIKGTRCCSVGLNQNEKDGSSFLLGLCVHGPGVARDDADAGAVDLVRQLHHPPQHDRGEEGAAGGGDPVHGARGGDGDGEAGRHLDEKVPRCCCQDCWKIVQGDPGGLAQGFVDLDLGSSPGWWAATVASYCPSRMVEHPTSKSTQPRHSTTRVTL